MKRAVPVTMILAGLALGVAIVAGAATTRPAPRAAASQAPRIDSFATVDVDTMNALISQAAHASEPWTSDPVRVVLTTYGPAAKNVRTMQLQYRSNRAESPDTVWVTVIADGYLDDSVRGTWSWLELARHDSDASWRFVEVRQAWRCWRGGQTGSYAKQPCP